MRNFLFNFLMPAAIFAALAYAFLRFRPETFGTIYGTRDYLRALHWWHGSPVLYGPELSGGGYAPGPFFYILASIPLEFGGDWYTLDAFKYLLAALGGVVLYFTGKRMLGPPCGIWLAALYVAGWEIANNCTKDWNASFQVFFSALCILGLIASFDSPRVLARRYLWATFLLIGVSMQVHASFFIFIIIFGSFQFFAPKLQWSRFSVKDISWAFLFLLVPLLPFMTWLFAGQHLVSLGFEPPPPLSVHSGLWDWILSRAKDVAVPGRYWKFPYVPQISEYLWHNNALNYVLFFSAVYVFAVRPSYGIWLRRLSVLVITMAVIYLPVYLGGMSSRYGFHWQVAYLVFAGVFGYLPLDDMYLRLARWWPSQIRQTLRAAGVFAVILLSWYWAHEVQYGQHHSSRVPMAPDDLSNATNLTRSQTEVVCKTIHQQTGWPAEKIMRRLLLIQFDDDLDLWAICEAYLKRQSIPVVQQKVIPDGYLLIRDVIWEDRADYWRTWWPKQNLPAEFSSAMANGKVKILPETKEDGITLIPYLRKDPLALPEEVGNLGYGYREVPGENLLLALDMDRQMGTIPGTDNSHIWFYFNRCRAGQTWCRTGVRVTGLGKAVDRSSQYKIEIYGTPLSQRMSWHHQYMAQEWRDTELQFECDGKLKSVPVASRIAKLQYVDRVQNDYFVTPIERTVASPCKGRVRSLALAIGTITWADNLTPKYSERRDVVIRHDFLARLRRTVATSP